MRYVKQIGLLIGILLLIIGIGFLMSFLSEFWLFIGLSTLIFFIILTVIGNVIGLMKIKKTMTKDLKKLKAKYDETNLKGFDSIEEIHEMMKKNHRLTKTYLWFILGLLILFPSVLFSVVLKGVDIQVFLVLLMMIYANMTIFLFKNGQNSYGYLLTKQAYPRLYDLLDKANQTMGVSSTIVLYVLPGNNATIAYGRGKHHITIGLNLLQMLNAEELFTILLHELAHLIHQDSLKSNRWYRSIELLDRLSGEGGMQLFNQYLFQAMAIYSRFKFEMYKQLSSKFIELRADEALIDKGYNKTYISAGLKIEYFENYAQRPLIESNLTKTEEPTATHFEDDFRDFLKYLSIHKGEIDQRIPKELIRKRHTHPTLFQRMERFGIDTFEIEPMIPYDETELQALLKVFDEMPPEGKDNYKYTYTYIYQPALKTIERYQENPMTDKMSLYLYVLALYDVGHIDAFMKASATFIEHYGGTGYLHYIRGSFLLNEYHDPKGIEEVYQAIDLSIKFVSELEIIGYAAVRLGLQEKLDEFRVKMLDLIELAFSKGLYTTKRRKLVSITPFSYDDTVMDFIKDTIQGDNLAYSAYLFKETYNDGFQQNHLLLTANFEDQERFTLGIQKVKMALSLDNEVYNLSTHMSKYYYNQIRSKVAPFYTKEEQRG